MRIAVLKERAPGESRVAATPETVKKFIALGASVAVERGAGLSASIPDADYEAAGATLGDAAARWRAPTSCWACRGPIRRCWRARSRARGSSPGSIRSASARAIDAYAAAGLEALAMEFMPRITRAQSMDILSSQSNLAGYKAVIAAADVYGRAFPMMMTAAGTISAARVFVMGVGVAGLAGDRHRAAARRAGFGTDVRSATKEQIQSLGAKPIFVESVAGIEGEGAGGYATEMSRGVPEGPGRTGLQPHRQAGHRHHHRADPGPAPRRA